MKTNNENKKQSFFRAARANQIMAFSTMSREIPSRKGVLGHNATEIFVFNDSEDAFWRRVFGHGSELATTWARLAVELNFPRFLLARQNKNENENETPHNWATKTKMKMKFPNFTKMKMKVPKCIKMKMKMNNFAKFRQNENEDENENQNDSFSCNPGN